MDIEGYLGERPPFPTGLIRTCNALRYKPLGSLTVEDVRVLIGQEIGLPSLIPIAIEYLEGDPLAEGDVYPGDLLRNVLRVDGSYWHEHPREAQRVCEVARTAGERLESRESGELDLGVQASCREFANLYCSQTQRGSSNQSE